MAERKHIVNAAFILAKGLLSGQAGELKHDPFRILNSNLNTASFLARTSLVPPLREKALDILRNEYNIEYSPITFALIRLLAFNELKSWEKPERLPKDTAFTPPKFPWYQSPLLGNVRIPLRK